VRYRGIDRYGNLLKRACNTTAAGHGAHGVCRRARSSACAWSTREVESNVHRARIFDRLFCAKSLDRMGPLVCIVRHHGLQGQSVRIFSGAPGLARRYESLEAAATGADRLSLVPEIIPFLAGIA